MTIEEYLCQALRLDQRINSLLREKEQMYRACLSIRSPQMGERVQESGSGEAAFVRGYEKVLEMDRMITEEIDRLYDLKQQIHQVIGEVRDANERMVLRDRYIHGMSCRQTAEEMGVDVRTIRRWHRSALEHAVLPKNPIIA